MRIKDQLLRVRKIFPVLEKELIKGCNGRAIVEYSSSRVRGIYLVRKKENHYEAKNIM